MFVNESGQTKEYLTSSGSKSYSDFKKDFRESTEKATGKFGEYKISIESGYKPKIKGFTFS